MKGEQIKTLDQLAAASVSKKAVTCYAWDRPMPAAVMLNMSGATILGRFRQGVFIYEPSKKFEWLKRGFSRKAVNK